MNFLYEHVYNFVIDRILIVEQVLRVRCNYDWLSILILLN